MKEEKEETDEPEGRFQYMMTPHAFATEESPERNDAVEEAERELAYLDQQEILILYEQEDIARQMALTANQTPQQTAASWFASKPGAVERPQTRSTTQPRKSPRLDRAVVMKKVAFQTPISALKRPVVSRRQSPPLRPISPLSTSPSPPDSCHSETCSSGTCNSNKLGADISGKRRG